MVIKPSTNNFKRPGLEYVLTYFDNPGVVLPPAITSWVAQKQMPDFLNKLYCATLQYAKQRKEEDVEVIGGSVMCRKHVMKGSDKLFFFFDFRLHPGTVFVIRAMNIHQIQSSISIKAIPVAKETTDLMATNMISLRQVINFNLALLPSLIMTS